MGKLRNSLFFRLTIPCLVAVFALGAAYSYFWSTKYEAEVEANFVETGRASTDLFAKAVAEALWEFDASSAERTLSGLKGMLGFECAVIYDPGGTFAYFQSGGEVPAINLEKIPSDHHLLKDGRLFFVSKIQHSEHGAIGDLVVVFDLASMNQMKWEARRDAIVAATIAFGLLGILQAVVARSVTLPLARITDVIEGVAAGNLKARLPDIYRADEVGRLSRALEVFQKNASKLVKVKAEAEVNQRIAELALVDDLTGISNRRALETRFSEIDNRAPPFHEKQYALLHIDLDGFKQINDTLGHQAGDYVIQSTAGRLAQFLDECEMVARVGGDEFVLILDQTSSSSTVKELASDVIAGLSEPISLDGQLIRLGASVGIASNQSGREKMSVTLANADIALYRAKAAGKGVAVEFDLSQRRRVAAKKKLSDEIMNGIEAGEFEPFFQPIVDAQTHKITSIELLARWRHPVEGILPPERFIGVATDINLMRHIDRQVLDAAIDIMSNLKECGYHLPRLSLNVSMTRLIEPDFYDTLAAAFQKKISVDLELLETTYIDDISTDTLWHLDRIREIGSQLHIDDFGTGHSSIAGLLKVGPDKLKIDKQFVMPALDEPWKLELVKIIIGIAELLDIEVVAEGVETLEHARLMKKLGAHYLQGFYFAKPIPFLELEQRLEFPSAQRNNSSVG